MHDDRPISVFDMLKIGVGPSSSHTLGPWRAASAFVERLDATVGLDRVRSVRVELFGSLAKTGRGHGTGIALMMGLAGHDPVTCDVDIVQRLGGEVADTGVLHLGGVHPVAFVRERDIDFTAADRPAGHPNAMRFVAALDESCTVEQTSFSVGGGFVEHADDAGTVAAGAARPDAVDVPSLACPVRSAEDLRAWAERRDETIAEVVRCNERAWRTDADIDADLLAVRDAMLACVERGVRRRGVLPGGLDVSRRAADLHDDLIGRAGSGDAAWPWATPADWFDAVRAAPCDFDDTVAWISCFALAVNEENAAFGRVVTAPTNGAAGVIPAVMFHHLRHLDGGRASRERLDAEAVRFLLVAAEIGAIFKKGSTISAAMGGCQAEIGVSAAMAAAALTECVGGSVRQSLMAAEIAMEHHLGLTCDPIGGLVQVPCIERNAIGAMKAISASRLARSTDPDRARVSLDEVISTMWETAQDMSEKYKETAEGGLAVRIPVSVVEC